MSTIIRLKWVISKLIAENVLSPCEGLALQQIFLRQRIADVPEEYIEGVRELLRPINLDDVIKGAKCAKRSTS